MAEILLTAGELPPPACGYASEQDRLDAYVASIIPTIEGGLQWQFSFEEPTDLDLAWCKLDADGRPIAILTYSAADARYMRVRGIPHNDGTPGGSSNAYTLTFSPAFTVATAYQEGRRYTFTANHTNTGSATIEVDGAGPITIVKPNGAGLASGDINSTAVIDVVISGGFAWIQTPTPQTVSVPQWFRGTLALPSGVGSGNQTSFATGLGGTPDGVFLVLVNVTGEAGYITGDEVLITAAMFDTGGGSDYNPGYIVELDGATVNIIQPVSSASNIPNKSTGVDTTFTPGNWNVRLTAVKQ